MHRLLSRLAAAAFLTAVSPLDGAASGIVSDHFDAPAIDLDVWTFVDPRGHGRFAANGSQLSLAVPAGRRHNLWTTGNDAPRLMQWVADPEFEIEVKFDSYVSEGFQMQGLLVEQDDTRFMRVEFHHNRSGPRFYAVVIDRGSASVEAVRPFQRQGAPMYLRLARAGQTWTCAYSADGETWQTVATFTHAMTVNGVGLYAGNYGIGNAPVPAHTAVIDYFILR